MKKAAVPSILVGKCSALVRKISCLAFVLTYGDHKATV